MKTDAETPQSDWEKIAKTVGTSKQTQRGVYEEIMNRGSRIVVVTLCSAGKLVSGGVPKCFFTHLFIDEAGQATEPLCLIPMTLLGPKGHLVLAGDPHQGPSSLCICCVGISNRGASINNICKIFGFFDSPLVCIWNGFIVQNSCNLSFYVRLSISLLTSNVDIIS